MIVYSVVIDRIARGYQFQVEPIESGFEMVAMDSTPRIIATVFADSPGAAAAAAWDKAVHMHDPLFRKLEAGT